MIQIKPAPGTCCPDMKVVDSACVECGHSFWEDEIKEKIHDMVLHGWEKEMMDLIKQEIKKAVLEHCDTNIDQDSIWCDQNNKDKILKSRGIE